jgi:hypothetical protein
MEEAASSQEVVEEDPVTGRWPAETAGVPISPGPDPAITEAEEVTGGEATEPQGGRTGVGADLVNSLLRALCEILTNIFSF